uniref:THD domain-containing protein n=1 Tax=Cyprinus carpio carpio TaxID=630221 RepID=A0A9J8BBG6_CYPCA
MEMTNEETACQVHAVLMEPEPVSRLRAKYHSLRRQVCLIQSISVLFCFSCCLLALRYHAFPPTCTENGTKEAPTFVKDNVTFTKEEGYVPWMYTPEYPTPNHTRYFILDDDNESLRVHHGGTYKVSLQITYGKSSEKTEEIVLQHDIHHYTDEYDKPLTLLVHWETVNLKYWKKSLFSEGIFSLKSGDRLKVWSNNRKLIDVGGTISQKTAFVVYPHFSF